jgi:hypothetical protein
LLASQLPPILRALITDDVLARGMAQIGYASLKSSGMRDRRSRHLAPALPWPAATATAGGQQPPRPQDRCATAAW